MSPPARILTLSDLSMAYRLIAAGEPLGGFKDAKDIIQKRVPQNLLIFRDVNENITAAVAA